MKKAFSKMDKPLLFITIVFFLFGLVMILSASSMESYMRYKTSPYYYFYKQATQLASLYDTRNGNNGYQERIFNVNLIGNL